MILEYRNQAYEVDYDYTPGRQGVHTLRNGDPGYPDEPAEIYITSVKCVKTGRKLKNVSGKMDESFTDDISEYESDRLYEEAAMAAEWERDIDR